jgi:topoisomerase-4 subunit A
MNLKEALQAFLDHRREVLQRRSRYRLAAVGRRMEVLRGLVIVYVNLDEVIRIIRESDDPKAEMMARWGLSDAQVEAILNMRLRTLRRLEEIAMQEGAGRTRRRISQARALARQRQAAVAGAGQGGRRERSAEFGGDTAAGPPPHLDRRRPEPVEIPVAALVEREPVTVLLSQKGWIRAVKGHGIDAADQKYKEGDGPRFRGAGRDDRPARRVRQQRPFLYARRRPLPGGRGQGEPLRLMIDLPNEHDVIALFPYRPGMRLLSPR